MEMLDKPSLTVTHYKLLKEQIKSAANSVPFSTLLHLTFTLLLYILLQTIFGIEYIQIWATALLGCLFIRFSVVKMYLCPKPKKKSHHLLIYKRRHLLNVTTIFVGLCWGILPLIVILSNGQMDLHIFIGASIVCLCSAGLANTARYIPAYLSFVIPSLSLFIISTFYYSEAMMYSCAALAILSMASLIYFGKRNEQTYKNQFFLNMNHEKLIKQYAITQKALITEKDKAERADAVKTDFLAIMSHEIRTPMNGLLGTIDLLQETELNEIQRKYISIAQETGKSLHYLLNDILDLIRLDEGSISLNPTNFNIKTATDTIRGTFSPIAIKNNIQLIFNISTNVPEHLYADDYKIRQVINNLISNALKFTSSGKVEIDFSLSGSDIDGDFLVVHVKDTGSGIPISFQKNIFKKFSQLDATKLRKKGGAGLGLAISKGIVELMNGDIGFTSEEGVGSDFWFTCPIIIPDNITHDTNDNNMDFIQNINGNQHKILIVDDSETNRFITREMLNNFNFNLSEVSSGDHAIKKAMDENFDLILMDISMPEMDGIEAMKKIKALSEAHKNIPIIALTAFSKQAIGNDFTELGMDGYLAKPISKKSLINEIKRHLNLSENKEYSALKETSVNKETLLNLINDVGFDATTRLFNVFRSETEQRFKNIKGYIQTENYPLLECESHALKSASYNFGLDQLGKTMDLMEQAAIKKDLKNIKNIAETAIQNFEIIPAEVKQL